MKASRGGSLTRAAAWAAPWSPSAQPPGLPQGPPGPGGEAAGATHCCRRGVAPRSRTALLRFPAHRSGWDSPPPHRDLQPLLLKRKTHRSAHDLIFTPMLGSRWLHSGLAAFTELAVVRWQLRMSRRGNFPESDDNSSDRARLWGRHWASRFRCGISSNPRDRSAN